MNRFVRCRFRGGIPVATLYRCGAGGISELSEGSLATSYGGLLAQV